MNNGVVPIGECIKDRCVNFRGWQDIEHEGLFRGINGDCDIIFFFFRVSMHADVFSINRSSLACTHLAMVLDYFIAITGCTHIPQIAVPFVNQDCRNGSVSVALQFCLKKDQMRGTIKLRIKGIIF